MTLQQMKYVITIAEVGSLTRAAELLYIMQPSLTASVQALENELGITIFNRTGKGMSLTVDGSEFIAYAKQVYSQYENLLEKYGRAGGPKKKFGVSTQHYSFAVKAFVEMVKHFDLDEYEFAIRETKTKEVIEDVSHSKSEVGILFLSDFNRTVITKLLRTGGLSFHKLCSCNAYVYLWKGHPLAKQSTVHYKDLENYPCLSFEQGENSSFYLAEEILANNEYPKIIKANDRATMLNLMIGLNGYTLCSGIICEELNGSDFVAVPYVEDEVNPNSRMDIGYIVKENSILSKTAERYIEEIHQYLSQYPSE